MKRLAIIIAVLLIVPSICSGWTGSLVRVIDGDTCVLADDAGKKVTIRLYGIDCPEKKQKYGNEASAYLRYLLVGQTIEVIEKGRDQYNRTIAKLFVDDREVNEKLCRQGFCFWYKKFAPKDYKYGQAQDLAQEDRLGVWKDNQPIVMPWDYRATKKAK